MEKDGLLESSWETSETGPARRGYELTEEGATWLHAWAGAHAETGESSRRSSTVMSRRSTELFVDSAVV